MALADTFDAHVLRRRSGCWEWTRAKNSTGYGQLWVNGRLTVAHRFAWARARGRIPRGMYVLHKCDKRDCVNPQHLYLGTYSDNLLDRHTRNPKSFRRGHEHSNSKLSTEQVREIRRLYRFGSREFGTYALARRFKVSKRTVWLIVNRETYRAVRVSRF